MKFKVGDKVRIVNKRTWHMNSEGEMDQYLGTVMTIKKDYGNDYRMIEDGERWSWIDDDIQCLASVKITKQELLDMPIGTKIYTDAEDEDYQVWVKVVKSDFTNGNGSYINNYDINEDLIFDGIYERYGTKIIKIEKPIYKTVYDYSTEVQEMTVAEIEKVLGHAVKIIKEDN